MHTQHSFCLFSIACRDQARASTDSTQKQRAKTCTPPELSYARSAHQKNDIQISVPSKPAHQSLSKTHNDARITNKDINIWMLGDRARRCERADGCGAGAQRQRQRRIARAECARVWTHTHTHARTLFAVQRLCELNAKAITHTAHTHANGKTCKKWIEHRRRRRRRRSSAQTHAQHNVRTARRLQAIVVRAKRDFSPLCAVLRSARVFRPTNHTSIRHGRLSIHSGNAHRSSAVIKLHIKHTHYSRVLLRCGLVGE